MASPLITVAIPTYNGAEFIGSTLQSVRDQEVDGLEIVVCDDQSNDRTLEIVSGFDDPRIRVLRHARGGLANNWNRCLEAARGRYFKLLPQDDLLGPDSLRNGLALLQEHSEMTLAFCRREVCHDVTDRGAARWARTYRRLDGPLQPLDRVNDGAVLLRRWADAGLFSNCVGEPVTTLFPAERARSLGGFAPRMRQDLDYVMWIRLMARGAVGFIAEAQCTYRFHAGNATRQNYRRDLLRQERLRMLEVLCRDEAVVAIIPGLRSCLRAEARRLLPPQPRLERELRGVGV